MKNRKTETAPLNKNEIDTEEAQTQSLNLNPIKQNQKSKKRQPKRGGCNGASLPAKPAKKERISVEGDGSGLIGIVAAVAAGAAASRKSGPEGEASTGLPGDDTTDLP